MKQYFKQAAVGFGHGITCLLASDRKEEIARTVREQREAVPETMKEKGAGRAYYTGFVSGVILCYTLAGTVLGGGLYATFGSSSAAASKDEAPETLPLSAVFAGECKGIRITESKGRQEFVLPKGCALKW